MDRADAILAAVRELYDAALEPGAWDRALRPIVAAVGGDTAVLLGEDLSDGSARFAIGCNMPPELAAAFLPAYSASGVVRMYRNAIGPDTAAFAASDAVPDDIFARSRFYHETVRPLGVFHSAFAISKYAPRRRASLAIGRRLGREDFGARNVETLRFLAPHLTTALRMRRELGAAGLLARDAGAMLDQLDIGVILADAEAQPRFVNRRARTIAAKADGLYLSSRGITAARPEETRMLHRAIAAVAAVAAPLSPSDTVDSLIGPATAAVARRLRLPRPSSKPPLAASVMPLCDTRCKDMWGESSSVAVFISEPDNPPRIDAAALGESYGLAPRETEVAVLLAEGLDPKEIACALGIGPGTAREHLKRALAKTNTRRQANLVRMVLSDFTLSVR